MIGAIVFSIIINYGNIETITGKLQGEALEQINTQINTLITTAPYMFFVSGIERIFAIGLQISLSIIVFYSVYGKKKILLYPLAILLHAISGILPTAMQIGLIKNLFLIEGFTCVYAIMVIIIARSIHKIMKEEIAGK